MLLRVQGDRTVGDGLAAESAVYSTLQAGPEFASWRSTRAEQSMPPNVCDSTVRVVRDGDDLHVTLARPERHNALNARMRDELFDAFTLARSDPSLRVRLDGEGPSFCAGGDLDEFGTFPDPATAHIVRLQRSIGGLIAAIADRVEVALHGASLGSGIELPAFAGRVVADPATTIGLPEVGLGLIPGAGGTVSITRRVGRHRTAWLALTGETIDASTALDWGLVDAVTPRR
jgi:enoyl-CoA hydratase/carnithine racemase